MKGRIIEIVELGQPQSLIQRENAHTTELLKTDLLIEELNEQLRLYRVSGRFSSNDVDLSYCCGVFNVVGIDGLSNELKRLKEINKKPHEIFDFISNER